MERNWTPEVNQNCFMPTRAAQKANPAVENEIYLYDEAEPLIYKCSESSMPPTSAGYIRALRSDEIITSGGGSLDEFRTNRKESRKSCKMASKSIHYQPNRKIPSPPSGEGGSLSKDVVSEFKSQILSKFKEFDIRPNSNSSNPAEDSKREGSLRVDTKSRSRENKSANKSQDIEELFIHKTKFFSSSGESEKVRIASEDLEDDVFSTGISEIDEGVMEIPYVKQKSDERAHSSRKGIDTTFATKSTIKHSDVRIGSPAVRASPRMGPQVQGRLFCLFDEIRKNNLAMKEDTFSYSSPKASEFTSAHLQYNGHSRSNNYDNTHRAGNCQRPRNTEMTSKPSNTPGKPNVTEAIEIYEATGGVENCIDSNVQQKRRARHELTPSDISNLPANIRYEKNQFDEFWRPVNLPHQNWFNGPKPAMKPTLSSKGQTEQTIQSPKQLPSPKNGFKSHDTNDLTSERHLNTQMNEYLEAKTSTPNRRQEKYVKLPGLAEAFVQRDSNFTDIRIKDGTSYESVNALREMSMRNFANENLEVNTSKEYEDTHMNKTAILRAEEKTITSKKPETKDAAIDIRIPLKNTKTQTGDWGKIMVDCFVQCESHVVDEADGRNVVKNGHQEIMVCNENGDGVQLYNALGHPLTDMDGYLLKDNLGRFLVRLDQYGVPISCTNGQAIFLEDSRVWDTVKNAMSIVHQSKKTPIRRDATIKKGKFRPSLRQLECAMKNLKNTLDWADKMSLDSSQENSINRFTNFDHSSLRNIKPPMDAPQSNNTTSLIAEMKSIAQLRETLLEKVNFMVENKNKLGKFDKYVQLGRQKFPKNAQEIYNENRGNGSTSLWQSQDRPNSPTFQTIKKFKERKVKNEPVSEMNSASGTNLTLPTVNHPDVVHKNASVDLWGDSVNSTSIGDGFPMKTNSRRNQPKFETDWWINSMSGNQLTANSAEKQSCGNETDLWNKVQEKSKDKLNSCIGQYSNYRFPVPQMKINRGLDEDPAVSDMRFVSKDTDIKGFSSLRDTDSSLNQMLISIEKEYNLRAENSWLVRRKREIP